jgi:hypothetical protein
MWIRSTAGEHTTDRCARLDLGLAEVKARPPVVDEEAEDPGGR